MAGRVSRASAGLRRALAAGLRRAPHVIADSLGFAGAGAIAYGAWLIYVPAGFLVGGGMLMALSMLIGRKLERAPQ
jgi:hypothetical protein